MKKIFYYLVIGVFVASASSCEKYLDINDNPNNATTSSPALVLPQAITGASAITSSYNNYGSNITGYLANAGGFAGFGSLLTYSYTTLDNQFLWSITYDNLNDFEYVINSTRGSESEVYYNAAARIMKVYDYQKLVDTYNDVPYTQALQGNKVILPTYDKAEDIYKDLVAQCDSAMQTIAQGQTAAIAPSKLSNGVDPLFNGDMSRWVRFANTLKLRLLVKMNGVPSTQAFADSKFPTLSSAGFLIDDAIVNPGYAKADGRQNPQWNTYAYPTSGTTVQGSGRSRIPTKFILSYYNGLKLSDNGRGSQIYRNFPSTASNQLGNEGDNVPNAPTGYPAWYTATTAGDDALGVLKGASMGEPLMLAAESYFLQAEAMLYGKLAGTASTAFNSGITSSFKYTYKTVNNTVASGFDPAADAMTYMTTNSDKFLANYDLATSDAQKLEAIITQKYIALNFIHGDEAFNEFRRTTYPKIVNGSASATETFASSKSISTRADKLPSRILYPNTEFQFNPANVPTGIDQFTSRIFWDLN